ncbi:MAG: nucleotidyltransferase family protein [Bacteroidota bacterium]
MFTTDKALTATGIVILAAGSSSRLGKPKQLLTYQGKTLLERVLDCAIQTPFRPIVVVLGAYAEEISALRLPEGISIVVNDQWQHGMGTSISVGLSAVLNQQPDMAQVIFSVADQVFITAEVFMALFDRKQQTGKNIIASTYAQAKGVPVLFDKKYFGELLLLAGEQGAKTVLKQHADDTDTILFESGHVDVDTEQDYLKLISSGKSS